MRLYNFNIRWYYSLLLLIPLISATGYSQESKNDETGEIVMSKEELESLLTKIAEKRKEKLKQDKVLQFPTYRQPGVTMYQNQYPDMRNIEYKLDLLLSRGNLLPRQGGNTTFNLPSQPSRLVPQSANPANANQITNGGREVLKGHEVYFANNSTVINANDRRIIKELVPMIKENQDRTVVVLKGFASVVGNSFYNNQLSFNRADAIKQILVNDGVSPGNIMILYHGSDKTVPANEARRVEITLEAIPYN